MVLSERILRNLIKNILIESFQEVDENVKHKINIAHSHIMEAVSLYKKLRSERSQANFIKGKTFSNDQREQLLKVFKKCHLSYKFLCEKLKEMQAFGGSSANYPEDENNLNKISKDLETYKIAIEDFENSRTFMNLIGFQEYNKYFKNLPNPPAM
jgi:hypothetical protein